MDEYAIIDVRGSSITLTPAMLFVAILMTTDSADAFKHFALLCSDRESVV
jgi:hypothetical protein